MSAAACHLTISALSCKQPGGHNSVNTVVDAFMASIWSANAVLGHTVKQDMLAVSDGRAAEIV